MIPKRSVLVALMAFCVALNALAEPPLTTARAAHSLTLDEARRGYAVRLKATVTYYDPYTDPKTGAFFACDQTSCICVLVPPKPILPIQAGTIVEIRGVSNPGNYAPIVIASEVRAVGQSHLPTVSPRRTLGQLMTGADDSQWTEVEGVVRAVSESEHNATLTIALIDGIVQAITTLDARANYERLVDSKIVIHGNAAPLFTKNRQMIGARLLFPSPGQVRIEEPPTADPFSLPLRPISGLLRFTPDAAFVHRVRVRGRVTLQWPGRWVVIQDGDRGLFIPTAQKILLNAGDEVDAVGFPVMGEYALTLENVVLKRGPPGDPIAAASITAQNAMKGDYDARLIQIRGRLVNVDVASGNPTLVMSSGGMVFLAVLPPGTAAGEIASWRAGSELRLTGICSVQVDKYLSAQQEGAALPKSFRVLLRSPADVTVLQSPSWWTTSRILVALGISMVTTVFGTLWVVALKRRVEERTETIRATLESTTEGILVIDSAGKIVEYNQKFLTMWAVPETILGTALPGWMEWLGARLKDPETSVGKCKAAHADAKAKTDDVIELADGRVFECHSEPQNVKGRNVGRVWGFRDVTELREQTRQLQELARSDSLTGISNRRAIFEFLSDELTREQLSGDSLTVIMADIDRFKKINDYFGHAAGDTVLRETAHRLKSGLRLTDSVGRYGGEEFLIVLPGCGEESARRRGEELRRIVESEPVVWEMKEIRVTCSFGVASTTAGCFDMRQLLGSADAALYRAKQAGRNCVAIGELESPHLSDAPLSCLR